jgi:uncharacterized sporulation protein YeaH/YhbH (DUF444 family)
MAQFIDRRLNPKGKSLGNRQRFLQRARGEIRDAIQRSLKDRKVSDVTNGEQISIPSKSTREPRFRFSSNGGERDRVLPGNKEFVPGDQIKKPPQGGGGARGKQASDSGDGEDDFQFTLTQEEFLEVFFEDLELPNLIKTSLKEIKSYSPRRAGITTAGAPTNMNVIRTMRNAFGRRLALKRPSSGDVAEIRQEIFRLESKADKSDEEIARLKALHEELEGIEARRRWVPFIDPIDVRYNAFEPTPVASARAVMFCLMDVSGSMGEREKDLAKRFFLLLHLFLKRRYERVDIVFIRHTHDAQEVDEETFFYSPQSGGTIVSTALEEMIRIMDERYAPGEWNIYAAQASDGYTQSGDAEHCVQLLHEKIMPYSQYYAYIEILDEREMEVFASEETGAELWRAYTKVRDLWANFAMKRISQPAHIYPVFRELFANDRVANR